MPSSATAVLDMVAESGPNSRLTSSRTPPQQDSYNFITWLYYLVILLGYIAWLYCLVILLGYITWLYCLVILLDMFMVFGVFLHKLFCSNRPLQP